MLPVPSRERRVRCGSRGALPTGRGRRRPLGQVPCWGDSATPGGGRDECGTVRGGTGPVRERGDGPAVGLQQAARYYL